MEFESKLSPDTMKERLITNSLPLTYSNYLSAHKLLGKWNKDDTFYLLKTGGPFSVRNVLPFVGRIAIHDNTTYIVGKFTLAKSAKVILTCFFGLAWIMILFGCFLNNNFDIFGKVFVFIAITVWTILGYALFRFIPGIFQKKQQADVIKFIKQHLM